MKLTPVVLDFESFWSQDHTLRKMTPVDYVMHPDTEIQSCSITLPGKETVVVFGEKQLRQVFARMPWHKLYAIGHNMSGFDALILAWRFGINPAMWGCTMAMARPRYAKVTPLSLDALLKYFKAPFEKGSLTATNTKGLRLAEFTPEMLSAIREYNKIDGDGCMWLFKRLIKETGWRELQLLDATIRMTVERRFVCDTELVADTLETVQTEKRAALLQVAALLDLDGIGEEDLLMEARSTLASQPKFAAVLTHYGFEVPMKVSKTAAAKGEHKLIPALAKSDDGMLELCESDHPVIGPAAQARLGVKSTQLETRLQTFLRWAEVCGGTLPMPLHYCGADTSGRWSGAMSANVQNLPRLGKVKKHSDTLRACLMAPKGFKVIVADQSGIELRVNHTLWQEEGSMALYREDPRADLYRAFASERYGVAPQEVSDAQRQLGKLSHLGLGFGASSDAFVIFAKAQFGMVLDPMEAAEIVRDFRSTYSRIARGWRTCGDALLDIYLGREREIDPWGLTHTEKSGIRLPSGRLICYPGLHEETNPDKQGRPRKGWWYGVGRHRNYIYSSKAEQNIVQSLARDIIADNLLEFKKRTGFNPAHTVHDELIYIVPEREAESLLDELQTIMRTSPRYWPELVLWSEGAAGDRYSDAK